MGRGKSRVFENQQGEQCVCQAVKGNVDRNQVLGVAQGQILPWKNTVFEKTSRLRKLKIGNIMYYSIMYHPGQNSVINKNAIRYSKSEVSLWPGHK